ncbi:MAG: hypothetical protein RBS34_12895 [Desulfofustis sp.]|jgi:hypothetical protein|nr:hypothetical protein [Desulfofustis sp.]
MPTNKELAQWTGISYQALSKFICGSGGMSLSRLLDVSNKTGIPADDLLRLRGGKYRGAQLRIKLIDAYRAAKDNGPAAG